MNSFRLKILTPDRTAFDGLAECAVFMDVTGRVTVLSGHAPMVSVLAPGPIRILAEGKERTGWASAGILHVAREETAALLDSFEWDAER